MVVPSETGLFYRTMRWGLVRIWAEDLKIGSSLINARVETAARSAVAALSDLSLAKAFISRRRRSIANRNC